LDPPRQDPAAGDGAQPDDTARPGEVTQLLAAAGRGDRVAHEQLFRLVYQDLRRLAGYRIAQQGAGHSVTPTALVHELYLRLVEPAALGQRDRQHFFAVAARAMRQILVDHARRKGTAKRGLGAEPLEIDERTMADARFQIHGRPAALLALDAALDRLAAMSARLAEIVELHYFGGFTFEEIGSALDLSERTIKRDWYKARAFLHHELVAAGSSG
jgi:RNA polymerase sigma factor (TIGR02999 family)